MFKIALVSGAPNPDPAVGAYYPLADPLVVRGFLPSAIAVSRLRRLIPLNPPHTKIPAPLAPQIQNPRTVTAPVPSVWTS